jgi:hypothetical protein
VCIRVTSAYRVACQARIIIRESSPCQPLKTRCKTTNSNTNRLAAKSFGTWTGWYVLRVVVSVVVSVVLTGGDETGGDEMTDEALLTDEAPPLTDEPPLITRRLSQVHETAASPLLSRVFSPLSRVCSPHSRVCCADCGECCAHVWCARLSSAVADSAVAAMAMNLEAERARQAKVAAPQQAKLEKKRYMDALRYLRTHTRLCLQRLTDVCLRRQ